MKARQIARWALTAVFALGAQLAGAQPGGDFGGDFGGGMPPFPGEGFPRQQTMRTDNKEAARRMTDEMQRSLALTDKQYKKVYKLNLKWLDARSQTPTEETRPTPPAGGFGNDDRNRFDEGPKPGNRFPERQQAPEPRDGMQDYGLNEPSDEELAARNARLKKVLTAEQYAEWQKRESARRSHEHRKQPGDRFRKE